MNTSSRKNRTPKLIGITGGIGSGKSTVAKVFKALGVPVFNSDDTGKELLQNDPEVRKKVEDAFGDVYPGGVLDKKSLAKTVFGNKEKLNKLNAIVHPAVRRAFKNWVEDHSNEEVLLKEAAILIETGLYKELDELIVVTCPKHERIRRVMQRDNVSEAEVIDRMKHQLTDEEKRAHASYEIKTHDNEVLPQVIQTLAQIKSLTT